MNMDSEVSRAIKRALCIKCLVYMDIIYIHTYIYIYIYIYKGKRRTDLINQFYDHAFYRNGNNYYPGCMLLLLSMHKSEWFLFCFELYNWIYSFIPVLWKSLQSTAIRVLLLWVDEHKIMILREHSYHLLLIYKNNLSET